jgi:hypothetical protein
MSSSYTLRPTSYTGDHLDRELTLRGARTSGSTQRKQQRLQRFVEAEKADTARFEAHHQRVIQRIDNRIEELRVSIPTIVRPPTQEVRRSTRIAQLLSEYLGY